MKLSIECRMYQAVDQRVSFLESLNPMCAGKKKGSGNSGISREAEKKYLEDSSEASEREATGDGCF